MRIISKTKIHCTCIWPLSSELCYLLALNTLWHPWKSWFLIFSWCGAKYCVCLLPLPINVRQLFKSMDGLGCTGHLFSVLRYDQHQDQNISVKGKLLEYLQYKLQWVGSDYPWYSYSHLRVIFKSLSEKVKTFTALCVSSGCYSRIP